MRKPPAAWSRFRTTRERTLAMTSSLSQEQLDYAPARGRWSVGEVLDHLIQVDALFRGELEELLALRERRGHRSVRLVRTLADAGLSLPLVPKPLLPLFDLPAAAAGVLFPSKLRQSVFANRAVPAKAPRRIAPRRRREAQALRTDLVDFLDFLESYFGLHAGIDWSRLRYYNPLTGFTNVPGIVGFIGSHERRHQKQIRDLLRAKSFPGRGEAAAGA